MIFLKEAGGSRWNPWLRAALGALLVALSAVTAQSAYAAPAVDKCVVIDTDFDIDDMMAIPIVIGNRHVAAIVTSEGYTMAESGAAALSRLVAEPNERQIPIIIGADTHRTETELRKNWPWLPYFRAAMNRANDWLAAPLTPARRPFHNFVPELSRATANCRKIDVLIIGTYTSFIRYSAALASKLERVVVMGKPIGDPTLKPGKYSFNCGYDLPACKTAMELLANVKTNWVDVPRGSDPLYEPSLNMVERLRADGLPGSLKAALLANQHTWNPTKVPASAGGPGGESLMWDQSAAIYLLHPELFGPVGHHYEPLVLGGSHARTNARLLRIWTRDTNAAAHFR
ncbi:nucleoside hydrolase [Kaistia algarum]|uniref:nucleoside hydrolase n=1 Tax=Kaistia algarum TaxID=2083279 RepID=UPI0014032577|nr:nucleoside hydrolase [Kaistia algarum]MCX5516704.1 nucleoside hydrolase [Kaistia algarum]